MPSASIRSLRGLCPALPGQRLQAGVALADELFAGQQVNLAGVAQQFGGAEDILVAVGLALADRLLEQAVAWAAVGSCADADGDGYAACEDCEKLVGRKCSVCGCFISLKSKLLTEDCPEGKWVR